MNKEIKERLEKLEKEIGIHDGLIHDIYDSLIMMSDKKIAQDMKRLEDLEPTAVGARRLYHFAEAELAERKMSKEEALHHGLEIIKEIRKKEIERELKDVEWTIHTVEKILIKYPYPGPHREMASDLSEAKKRKRILLGKLSSMDEKVNIININDKATVKLTAHGQEILRQFYCGSELLITSHHIADNVYTFQIWELMKTFGKHMDNGMKQIFEDNKIFRY